MDYEKIDSGISALFPGNTPSFSEMLENVMSGDLSVSAGMFTELLKNVLNDQADSLKNLFVFLLVIGIIAAVFGNFMQIFENRQMADICFYFTYMILILNLLNAFFEALDIIAELTEKLRIFMELLLPAYFFALTASGNTMTAAGFYSFVLGLIYVIEAILPGLMIPAISLYAFGNIISMLVEDDRFAPLMELLKKTVRFLLKCSLTVVSGFGIMQSMIAPVIDKIKNSAVQKTIGSIPGIGDLSESVSKMVLGSAVLVKNSIGVVMLILLIAVCLIPLAELLLIGITLRFGAGVMAFFTEKRMAVCTDRVGESIFLLLQTGFCAIALLFITIAIICVTTQGGI